MKIPIKELIWLKTKKFLCLCTWYWLIINDFKCLIIILIRQITLRLNFRFDTLAINWILARWHTLFRWILVYSLLIDWFTSLSRFIYKVFLLKFVFTILMLKIKSDFFMILLFWDLIYDSRRIVYVSQYVWFFLSTLFRE